MSRKAMKAYNFLRVAQRRGKNRKKTSSPPDVCGIKWKCLLKKESLPSSGNSITRAVIFSRVINNAFPPLFFFLRVSLFKSTMRRKFSWDIPFFFPSFSKNICKGGGMERLNFLKSEENFKWKKLRENRRSSCYVNHWIRIINYF